MNQCSLGDFASNQEIATQARNACCREDDKIQGGKDFYGNFYCWFHLKSDKKIERFNQFLSEKRNKNPNDSNFVGFYFPTDFALKHDLTNADFRFATFAKFATFSDKNFSGETKFNNCQFKGEVSFNGSVFKKSDNNTVSETDFSEVVFSELADFADCQFENEVTFEDSTFEKNTYFTNCNFDSKTIFKRTQFKSGMVSFSDADFSGETYFSGKNKNPASWEKAYFHFDTATFKEPGKIHFLGVSLNPSSFIRTDPRKIDFTNVKWKIREETFSQKIDGFRKFIFPPSQKLIQPPINAKFNLKRCLSMFYQFWFYRTNYYYQGEIKNELESYQSFDDEIRFLDSDNQTQAFTVETKLINADLFNLLSAASRRLALNSEEDNRYKEASQFRFLAVESDRTGNPWAWQYLTLRGWLFWFYKILSGYGEKVLRTIVFFLLIWIGGACFYNYIGVFEKPENKSTQETKATKTFFNESPLQSGDFLSEFKLKILKFEPENLTYSIAVMTLQKPDPKPIGMLTKTFVVIQSIFGPLVAALLALALRRQFMR